MESPRQLRLKKQLPVYNEDNMLEKNKVYRAEITDVNNFGDGVCRIDGVVTFVKGGVSGDILDVKIIKTAKSYAVAAIDKFISRSVHRCENSCPVYKRCGGCVNRHIDYGYELELKRGYVEAALKRNGLEKIRVHETTSTFVTEGYRNKAQYPVGRDSKTGKVKIGFYADHTHEIADVTECLLAPPVFSKIISDIRRYIEENDISVYDEKTHNGLIRHIYLRRGEMTGDIMLCIVINGDNFKCGKEFAQYIVGKNPEITGVLVNINSDNTNVILSDNYRLIFGRDYINDELCGRKFRISKSAFYQVNRAAAELLYKKAGELAALKKGDILIDLYCGVGTVGMSIADPQTILYGIEIVPEAIENARKNAELNGFFNSHFAACDAGRLNEVIAGRAEGDLVIIADPPRKGLSASVIRDIALNSPDRVVYISCNPETLARDISEFKKHGYFASDVYPFDLFPRTGHVECCVLLCREDRK